jgi:hypothetical protein
MMVLLAAIILIWQSFNWFHCLMFLVRFEWSFWSVEWDELAFEGLMNLAEEFRLFLDY